VQRVRSGEAFDVLIATSSQIANLEKEGIVGAGTKRDLAKVGIGVYVKKGPRKPDVSTVEQFKQTLLKANSIAYIDPASGGASGIYISDLLQRLGIAEELRPKTKSPKVVAEVFDRLKYLSSLSTRSSSVFTPVFASAAAFRAMAVSIRCRVALNLLFSPGSVMRSEIESHCLFANSIAACMSDQRMGRLFRSAS
jgi:ABC-type molybdate transport system substrate-binding protein